MECRTDDQCEAFQICDDDGECVCRDELCPSSDLVCTSEDGVGVCACRDENCPGFTLCD